MRAARARARARAARGELVSLSGWRAARGEASAFVAAAGCPRVRAAEARAASRAHARARATRATRSYLLMGDEQIHWFSIINSLMIVLFLSGMVAMIMLRTLHRDFQRYNQLEVAEEVRSAHAAQLVLIAAAARHGQTGAAAVRARRLGGWRAGVGRMARALPGWSLRPLLWRVC